MNSRVLAEAPNVGITFSLRAFVRWIDRNLERHLMVAFYAALALIISIEVARRYLTGQQTQWGSTVSIYCFIWLAWLGCAYHVRTRRHLRFDALREKLPRIVKAACYIIDDLLWIVLACVVLVGSADLISAQIRLDQVVEGTLSVPMVLATAAIPTGWVLVVIRAVQDMVSVVHDYRSGQAFERSVTDEQDVI